MKPTLYIGTRGSPLALWQAEWVKATLTAVHPQTEFVLRIIQTTGDKIMDTALAKIGDKGLFTKEIEIQLLEETIDLAVHSLKDMPTQSPPGLCLAAITEREDPADVLVSKKGLTLDQLPTEAKVLTGSLRRQGQLLHRRPDLQIVEVRGNIQTRLQKLDQGDTLAIIMAGAGLKRSGLQHRITERLNPLEFLPACGQGALAVEIRENDSATAELIKALDHQSTRITTTAERMVLAVLEGGCQVPIGAYAQLDQGKLILKAMISDLNGERLITAQREGSADKPEKLGRRTAEDLFDQGGRVILDEIR